MNISPGGDANGEWRSLHNEELHSLYRSPNTVRVIKYRTLKWTGHVARMKEDRRAFKVLTGKLTGKRTLIRPRHRWNDNIRIDLKELVCFGSGYGLLENPCECRIEPST